MSNDTVNLLAMVLILIASGCIKYSPSEQSSEAQQTIAEVPTKRNSNKKSVQQLLESFRGGTIDLREKTNFTISGTFNEEKLLKTNITIRGNGTLILKSGSAFNLVNSAKEVNLGLNKFDFVEVEEFYQGESIYTEYGRNEMSSINYKLKL